MVVTVAVHVQEALARGSGQVGENDFVAALADVDNAFEHVSRGRGDQTGRV